MLRRMRRAPSVLVALGAALAELIIVAAAGNQWVVNHLIRHPAANELPRDRLLKLALTSFSWRFTAQSGQHMIWLAGIVSAAGLVVAVFLLVWAFVGPMRPPRNFVSVFLGTWGIVVVVTQIAAVGQALLAFGDLFEHGHDPDGLGRFWFSMFHGPGAGSVLFGGASGLLVALVTAILASLTNRAAAAPEETQVPGGAAPEGEGGWQSGASTRAWQPGELAEPGEGAPAWPSPAEETTRSWSSPTTSTAAYPWGTGAGTTEASDPDAGRPPSALPPAEERAAQQRSDEPPTLS
jgi:hypothetical protein